MTRRRREPEAEPTEEHITISTDAELEHRLLRQRPTHPRTPTNPYNDGMPDYPELIQRMTQKQRDEILDRINKHSGKM